MSASPATNKIHDVYAYLMVHDTGAAIEFYRQAFGAEEIFRLTEPGGRIGHAEIKLGPAVVMLADEFPEYGFRSPLAYGGTGVTVHLHVDDVDRMTRQAAEAGATVVMEPKDQFYGERSSRVRDPLGHEWLLGQHIEDVSHDEMQRRYNALFE